MKNLPQILPQFNEIQLASSDDLSKDFNQNCAYLLNENETLSSFIEKIGKKYDAANTSFDLYDFYAAYNLNFPTIPSTVFLVSGRHTIAMGIKNFQELLEKILQNTDQAPMAVYLSIQERTPEEMLKIKRDILQQFIFLRMYLPIIIAENFKDAQRILNEIVNADFNEKNEITFIGTKKAGKSSLLNAILGADYSPSSAELPTPNKVTYTWGKDETAIRFECEGNTKTFQKPSDLREYLANEFRKANKNSSALAPMNIYLPNFPEDLKNFSVIDTPGPNFAAAGEAHKQVTQDAMKEMQHVIFVMNYSAHLTFNEMELFEKTYKIFNNKRRHQTVIIAVNRIDEMYAANEIKSYERFADYIKRRLNAQGYDNFVVVSVSAITAVYVEKIRQLLPNQIPNLKNALEDLADNSDEDNLTIIDFIEQTLKRLRRFHGLKVDSLDQIKSTSRVSFLTQIAESIYNPAEQFDYIDETFADIFDEKFDSNEEFFSRVLQFAEEGDPDAMNALGMLYHRGIGTEADFNKSFEWHLKSAEAGNPSAMCNVGFSYLNGYGILKDVKKAIKWFNMAAENGDSGAMVQLGEMYREGDSVNKDSVKAFELFKKAAESDNADAMVSLAAMYFRGEGTEKDLKKSFEWNIKAAEHDDLIAMGNIAYCYRYGEGVEKNIQKAVSWYEKAVAAGNTLSMNDLAEMHLSGEGVPENKKMAFDLFKIAAENENEQAMGNLAYCYKNGYGTEKNISQAFKWYVKASDAGNIAATYELSKMYKNGEGVAKDEHHAFELLKKAAKEGYEDAFVMLALEYYSGENTDKNFQKAMQWFKKAVDVGDVDAMCFIGKMYDLGEGVNQDHHEANKWYRKGAEKGDPYAMRNLAYNYSIGNGFSKSFSDAVYWYEKAIDNGVDAYEDLADLYDSNGYKTKAFKYYKLAAEKGSIHASFMMGFACYDGEGVEQSYSNALYWFRKSAEGGSTDAMYMLASMYHDGEGTNQNYSQSFYWAKKAAEGGDADAMNFLGNLYYNGKGCSQDYSKSTQWYKKAAAGGNAWGMYNLANNYKDGRGVVRDSDEAIRWYEKAANNGIDDALKQIANIYYDVKNYSEALLWYQKCADKGDADCMNIVGVMHESGKGCTKYYDKAVSWYKKAIEAGSVWALHNLAHCYYEGYGVQKNMSKAFDLFCKAANEGLTDSMLYLGDMYQQGDFVTKDYEKAMSWYEKARDAGNKAAQGRIDNLNKSKSSGGCFITTAVCDSFGKPDDCHELTAFRNFRDNWLLNQQDGKILVAEYYAVAPKIVSKINLLKNSADIYKNIWNDYLLPCLKLIEEGENLKCKKVYIDMVNVLKEKFLK